MRVQRQGKVLRWLFQPSGSSVESKLRRTRLEPGQAQ